MSWPSMTSDPSSLGLVFWLRPWCPAQLSEFHPCSAPCCSVLVSVLTGRLAYKQEVRPRRLEESGVGYPSSLWGVGYFWEVLEKTEEEIFGLSPGKVWLVTSPALWNFPGGGLSHMQSIHVY